MFFCFFPHQKKEKRKKKRKKKKEEKEEEEEEEEESRYLVLVYGEAQNCGLYLPKKFPFLVWQKACGRQAGVASHRFHKILELIFF